MRYTIGETLINTASRTITVAGINKQVQPKVFDLIVFLIENRDRAVSKQELQDQLWPKMEVTETALTRAVMKARKMLASEGSVIKTVHGHGYHLVASVVIDQPPIPQSVTLKSSTPKYMIGVVLLLALILSAVVYYPKSESSDQTSVAFLPVIDLTNNELYSWTSLGLMSLASQMLKSRQDIKVVSSRQTSAIAHDDLSLNTAASELAALKTNLQASHLIVSQLGLKPTGQLILKQVIHHPNGSTPVLELVGTDPTAMMQQLTQRFMASLPSPLGSHQYRTVSDDVFTNELYSRGMVYQLQGDAQKAKEYFHLVKQEDPKLFWPRYELALTTRQLGDATGSISELQALHENFSTMSVEPKAEAALFNALGAAFQQIDDDEQALKNYKLAFTVAEEHQDHKYQKFIASNIALSHRRLGQTTEARLWLNRSKQIATENGIELTGQINYQLAQLERNDGNTEQAIALFEEAKTQFLSHDMQRHVAATHSSLGELHTRMGQWEKAHSALEQSLALKIELNNPVGVVDTQTHRINLFIEQGLFSQARQLLDEVWPTIDNPSKETRRKFLVRTEIKLAHASNEPAAVKSWVASTTTEQLDDHSRFVWNTQQYKEGHTAPLLNWLSEYELKASQADPFTHLLYWDYQVFLSKHHRRDNLETQLLQHIEQSRRLGLYHKMGQSLVVLGRLQLANNSLDKALNTLASLANHQLSDWNVHLLRAEVFAAVGDNDEAQQAAMLAKQQATESWDQAAEIRWQHVQQNKEH